MNPNHFTVRLLLDEGQQSALVHTLARITREQGWATGDHFTAYKAASVCFGLYLDSTLLGGIQCILGGSLALPSFNVWPELAHRFGNRTEVAEVSILAVTAEHRGNAGAHMWALCIALFRYCKNSSLDGVLAAVTPKRLRQYCLVGLPFEAVGELRPHWGELCYPVWMRIDDAAREIRRKARASARYRRIAEAVYRAVEPGEIAAVRDRRERT